MPGQDKPVAALTDDQRARLEEFIEEEEGSLNRYRGWLAVFLTAVADWLGIGLIVIALLVHLARARATAPA